MNKLCLILLCLLLAACSAEQSAPSKSELEPLDVQLLVPPAVLLNSEIQMKVVITQGGKPVNDPEEVQFEIWKNGLKENSRIINAAAEGNGIYTATQILQEKAVYSIQAHVTARGFHTMPVAAVSAGGAMDSETEK